MSGARSVEYFLVVGVDDSTQSSSSHTGEDASSVVSPVSPMSPLSEHTSRGEHSLAYLPTVCYLQCPLQWEEVDSMMIIIYETHLLIQSVH